MIGVPIAWAVLLLFHPGGEADSIYASLDGDGTRMIAVHVGMMIFIPLLAFAIWLLLRGIETTAARVSRIALPVFVVFYVAWEVLQGISNGLLTDQVSALTEADIPLGSDLIQDFAEHPLVRDLGVFALIGSVALIVAAVAAGVALRDKGAPSWTPWILGLSAFLISGHPPPFGPTGLVMFSVAVVLLLRVDASAQAARMPVAAGAAPSHARFSSAERIFILGVPTAWALVLLLHPSGDGEDFYPIVTDEVTTWLVVHISTLVFVPLMAGVVLLLLRGIEGAAALVSRLALGVFAVVYLAWEVMIGIGTGVLVDQVNQLGAAEQAVGASVVEGFTDSNLLGVIEMVGTGAWIVALCAAGIALVRIRGVPVAVPVLLVLSAIPTAWHVAPFGQIGLALFFAAALIVVRRADSFEGAPRGPSPLSA